MMYDELIKRLRNGLPCYGEKCLSCPDKKHCVTKYEQEAADAIENLEKSLAIALLEYQIANNKRIMTEEYAKQKPKWIPVTERLPEYMKNVLVTDGIDVGMGWYDIYKRRDTGIIDKYWCTPNCDVDGDNVKYWAEMPSPPEREDE